MSVVKWSPLKELEDMRRDMDRLFEEFFGPTQRRRWPAKTHPGVVVPSIDMYDRKTEIVVKAELPGVKREDIDITLTKDSLTLKGEIKRDEEVKDEDCYAMERSFGTFGRTLTLPVEVDSGQVSAAFKDGILEIVLPKKEEARPQETKVEVK